jgi:hypothetical protein
VPTGAGGAHARCLEIVSGDESRDFEERPRDRSERTTSEARALKLAMGRMSSETWMGFIVTTWMVRISTYKQVLASQDLGSTARPRLGSSNFLGSASPPTRARPTASNSIPKIPAGRLDLAKVLATCVRPAQG